MTHRSLFLAMAALLAVAAGACSDSGHPPLSPTPVYPTPAPAPTPAPTVSQPSLRGNVTDALTGGALAGATITVTDGPNAARVATSDSTGFYYLGGLTPAGFTIRTQREGYDVRLEGVTLTGETWLNISLTRAPIGPVSNWRGTFTHTINGVVHDPLPGTGVTSQSGTNLTGTFTASWRSLSGWLATEQISFTGTRTSEFSDARISGTLRYIQTTDITRCSATGVTFNGTVTPFRIVAPVMILDDCIYDSVSGNKTATNVTLEFTR